MPSKITKEANVTAINLLALATLVPWAVIYFLGVPKIYTIMGGSFGYYALYPILIYLQFKFPEYRKIFWLLILTFMGLIGANCLHSYFIFYNADIKAPIYLLIIMIPLSLIITGYMGSIEVFIKRKDMLNKEVLKNLAIYCLFVMLVPFYFILSIIIFRLKSEILHLNALKLFFGALITSGLVLLIETRKLSYDELEFFSIQVKKQKITINKAHKYLVIGIIFILIFSTYWEIYRGDWFAWIETAVIFCLYAFFQFRFAGVIFTPIKACTTDININNFPSIRNKTSILVGLIFLVLFVSATIFFLAS